MRLEWALRKIHKFFLKFRKTAKRAKYNKKLIIDDTDVTDQTCILNHIKDFYEALFNKHEQKTTVKIKDLISSQQTAYVKNRHIGETGRLISDLTEITEIRNIEGFLVTMDIEKAFDSLDHNFLISTLEKYGFGQNFI